METQHRFAPQEPLDRSVLTTWTLLFRRLEERSANADKLLILWGFLDNHDIWYDLFKSALNIPLALELPRWYTDCVDDYSNFIECTQLFVLYSFIDINMGFLSFSVHPVLLQWCFQASEDNITEMAWLAFVLVASSATSRMMMDDTLIQRRLLPHCDRLCFLLRETIPKVPFNKEESLLGNAYHVVGDLYRRQAKLREAEEMYVRALAGKEKALKSEHTSTLDTVNSLGKWYIDQGKLKEAEDMHVRALMGYEKALGPEHTLTIGTILFLGNSYKYQGRLGEAKDMYVQALAGYEKALGPEHISTLLAVHNLGTVYIDQGKLGEAEDMFVQALAGYEKALGSDHTPTLLAMNDLGSLYRDQGKLEEAEEMLMRALAGYQKALGPQHTSTMDTIFGLGSLYKDQGK